MSVDTNGCIYFCIMSVDTNTELDQEQKKLYMYNKKQHGDTIQKYKVVCNHNDVRIVLC